jgi:hypothetical protein
MRRCLANVFACLDRLHNPLDMRSRRVLARYSNLAEKEGFCPSILRNSQWRW